jgi:tetratricopeptide (TPR) repeat protein
MRTYIHNFILYITAGILFVFTCTVIPAHARSDKDTDAGYIVYKGNTLYEQGSYNDAIREYSKLLEQDVESGHLYYNIANAYFKKGELGKAILHYERSKRLIPRDSDLKLNYKFALSQIQADTAKISTPWKEKIFGSLRFLTLNELTVLASCLFVLTVLLLVARLYIRMSSNTFSLLLTSLIVMIVFTVTSVWIRASEIDKEAVTVADSPEVKFEPFESATTHFTLHEGMRIYVIQSKQDWMKIKRSDGKTGWVRKNAAEII